MFLDEDSCCAASALKVMNLNADADDSFHTEVRRGSTVGSATGLESTGILANDDDNDDDDGDDNVTVGTDGGHDDDAE